MSEPLELPYPLKGLSENLGKSKQDPLTTRDEQNMRGIDPVTGSIQGAQRAGTTLEVTGFAQAQGTKIQHIMSDTYEADVINYTQVTNLDFNGGGADTANIEWENVGPTNEDALDVTTDRQGNVYLLEVGGNITKYNNAREKQQRFSAPITSNEEIVSRIEVSQLGTVFILAGSTTLKVGAVYAFVLRDKEDKFYDLLWRQAVGGRPKDFRVDGGRLVVLFETDSNEDSERHGSVLVIAGSDTGTPFVEAEFETVSAANAVEVGAQNAVYVTAEADAKRFKTAGGFTVRTNNWSPHELSSAFRRIYTWLDVETLTNIVHGAPASVVPYRRTWDADRGVTGITEIEDDTDRALNRTFGLGDQANRFPPRYAAGEFGDMPGIKFNKDAKTPPLTVEVDFLAGQVRKYASFDEVLSDVDTANRIFAPNPNFRYGNSPINVDSQGFVATPNTGAYNTAKVVWDFRSDLTNFFDFPVTVKGQGITSGPNRSSDAKETTSDALEDSLAVFPATDGAIFTTCMVLRFRRSTSPEIVFQHKGENFEIGVIANMAAVTTAADYDDTAGTAAHTHTGTEGSFTLFLRAGSLVDAGVALRAEGAYNLDFNGADNETDAGILTIIHNANAVANTGTYIRWNGELIERIAGTADNNAAGGNRAFTSFGGYAKAYASELDMFTNSLDSFDGGLAEVITVWGRSTLPSSPHDTVFDHADTERNGALNSGVRSSFSYTLDASEDEWERLEGYLAHKWGLSHLLPNGLAAGTFDLTSDIGTFYRSNHRFGGTANPPTGAVTGSGMEAGVLALRTLGTILAKYSIGNGALKWAYAGEGVGYGVVSDDNGDVMTIGAYTESLEVDGTPKEAVTAKKFLDFGNTFQTNTRQDASLVFGPGLPSDGDTFRIQIDNGGAGSSDFTFTFRNAAAVDRDITIGADEASTARATQVVLFQWYDSVAGGNLWKAGYISRNSLPITGTTGTVTIGINLSNYASGMTNILTEAAANVARIDFTGGARVPGAWEYWTTLANAPSKGDARILADDDGDLYYPLLLPNAVAQARKLEGTSTDGQTTQTWELRIADLGGAPADRFSANGIAFEPDAPPYDGATPATGPESLYVATDTTRVAGGASDETAQAGAASTIHKYTLVSSVRSTTTSPRLVRNTVISGGDLLPWTGTYGAAIEAGVFSATAPEVQSTSLYSKRYITDGLTFKVYDPKLNTVEDMVVTGNGKLPKRVALLTSWRGRLVVVSYDDRHNWHMSRQGDPEDWDEFPPEGLSFEQAISGNHPDAIGKFPDVVNALVPYNDQVLIALCDSQIYRMVGDPMIVPIVGQGGGQRAYIGLVSDITGGAFGQQSWAKDPNGVLYFIGSKGGVWAMQPNGMPQRISYGAVERLLSSFDLDTYRLALVWNREDEGLHLFQLPVGTGGTQIPGYFWEQKTNSWHPDAWSAAEQQPTAVEIIDGDQFGDRKLVIGTEDGQILRWDKDAYTDNLTRIESYVVMGPYQLGKPGRDYALVSLTTELAEQGGADVQVFVGQSATLPEDPVWEGAVTPGRNPTQLLSAAGEYVWIRYSNARMGNTEESRWAHEKSVADVVEMGFSRSVR